MTRISPKDLSKRLNHSDKEIISRVFSCFLHFCLNIDISAKHWEPFPSEQKAIDDHLFTISQSLVAKKWIQVM
ncbi:unnamed protein product, partial [Oppiella nova]